MTYNTNTLTPDAVAAHARDAKDLFTYAAAYYSTSNTGAASFKAVRETALYLQRARGYHADEADTLEHFRILAVKACLDTCYHSVCRMVEQGDTIYAIAGAIRWPLAELHTLSYAITRIIDEDFPTDYVRA